MVSKFNSDNLEYKLEKFIEKFIKNIMVKDFQPQAQQVFNKKIQNIVTDLQEINNFKDSTRDIQIPLEVLKHIDVAQNPQLYTNGCFDKAIIKNHELKGKIDSFKKFKANMLIEFNRYFPNEIEKYRAVRNTIDEYEDED